MIWNGVQKCILPFPVDPVDSRKLYNGIKGTLVFSDFYKVIYFFALRRKSYLSLSLPHFGIKYEMNLAFLFILRLLTPILGHVFRVGGWAAQKLLI